MVKGGHASKYYRDLDKVHTRLVDLLNTRVKSDVLQDYASKTFASLFYANAISNFLNNLTQENINEYSLPKDKILSIKKRFADIRKDTKLALRLKNANIDESYYSKFKSSVLEEFPQFSAMLTEIEKMIGMESAGKYLQKKIREFKKTGKPNPTLDEMLWTFLLEAHISATGMMPKAGDIARLSKKAMTPEFFRKLAELVTQELDRTTNDMLAYQDAMRISFEDILYSKWKLAFEPLECLMQVSLESVDMKRKKWAKSRDKSNKFKKSALVQIHARALQIANEIFKLLRAGFADGANSRWRSLYELAVTALFLRHNSDDVSRRYLEHEIIKSFKDANDYKKYYRKLGYPPLGRRFLGKIRKSHNELIKKYGKEFRYRTGYDWVPVALIHPQAAANPHKDYRVDFRHLEEHVKMSRWRPFYNLSANAVHSGAKGFYRLGLLDSAQHKLLLVGASDYGLADPLENTAISLSQITGCLLGLQPDFEDVIQTAVIVSYVERIGPIAVRIQKKIEKHGRSMNRRARRQTN